MCQQIIEFCNGSTKPLLFVGALLSLLLSIAIGYTACTTQALYSMLDAEAAQTRSLCYYMQLAGALYLLALAILSCQAAYYDQKHSVRALALVSTLTWALAIAAVLMVPTGPEISNSFVPTLEKAKNIYDFKEPLPAPANSKQQENSGELHALNSTHNLPKRWANSSSADHQAATVRELNPKNATELWDSLQALGCCGLEREYNTTWTDMVPKSCCARDDVKNKGGYYTCEKPDENHHRGCRQLIENTGATLQIVLALIALVNLYLAVISGISTYRTIHYSEASQAAYA